MGLSTQAHRHSQKTTRRFPQGAQDSIVAPCGLLPTQGSTRRFPRGAQDSIVEPRVACHPGQQRESKSAGLRGEDLEDLPACGRRIAASVAVARDAWCWLRRVKVWTRGRSQRRCREERAMDVGSNRERDADEMSMEEKERHGWEADNACG